MNGMCLRFLTPPSHSFAPIHGCTDPTAENYDPYASEEDGSCWVGLTPCDDGSTSVTFDGYTYDLGGHWRPMLVRGELRNEHYANGDAIPGDLSDGEWMLDTTWALKPFTTTDVQSTLLITAACTTGTQWMTRVVCVPAVGTSRRMGSL